MRTRTPIASSLGMIPALIATAGALASLPPSTQTCMVNTSQTVSGMGPVNSPFLPSQGQSVGAESFGPVAINNSNYAMAVTNVYAAPPLTSALLDSVNGLSPYIGCGILPGDGPALGLPNSNYAALVFHTLDLNNNGLRAMNVRVGTGEFGPTVTPFAGVVQDKTTFVVQDGQAVTAPGVLAGTTFGSFNSARVLGVNDANQYLVGASIIEGGITRNALFKITTNASGQVQSQSLVAKEGGPVGAGPATWTTLCTAPVAAAINSGGSVAFSGVTSTGERGVYVDSILVARTGDASPQPGAVWGDLLNAPVDINANGSVAIRGPFGDGTVLESGDAGQTYATAQATTQGTLNIISGALSTDFDVDLYRLRISDFSAFSATTVPAAGFPGSAGDTVLYLFRNFENFNGITRTVLARSDNAASGVVQSTLTAANLPADQGSGASQYYLAVATPKTRPVNSTQAEFFQEDPASLAVVADKVYWSDLSEGTIVRADIATGVIDATYQASSIPAPYAGQVTGSAPSMNTAISVADTGGHRYAFWTTSAYAEEKMRRADLNVAPFTVETIRAASNAVGEFVGQSGMVFDPVASRIYWSRPDIFSSDTRGVLNYSNPDGTGGATLIASSASGPRPRHLAVHPALRRIYFTETAAQRIARVNIDGATPVVTSVVTGITPTGIAVDTDAGKVYWSSSTTGIIERCNVDGTGREVFKSGLTSTTLTYNTGSLAYSGGFLYAADVVGRQVVRMSTAGLQPASQLVVQLPARIGDRTTDSPTKLDSLSAWVTTGNPSGSAIPYQIKLNGATAFFEQSIVGVNGVKVASTGDVLAGTNGAPLATVGSRTSPVRLSDTGLAAWRATWLSGASTITGLFLGADKVADSLTPVTGTRGGILRVIKDGPTGFDMSDSGQFIIASTIQSAVGFGETPENLVAVIAFDSIPTPPVTCIGDYNQDGGVDGADVEAFYNDWEAGDAAADLNQDGGIDGGDVETFFRAWENGC
ncbi:MAG: hypothetical protein JSR77_13580 [Planctomycetes bacterium]|nr:hypothetical protein [Planctomycetota bacterium]